MANLAVVVTVAVVEQAASLTESMMTCTGKGVSGGRSVAQAIAQINGVTDRIDDDLKEEG